MTTLIADARLGLMVSDSSVSDGDRVWIGRKVYRYRGCLIGFAGDVNEAEEFLAWWRKGEVSKPPKFTGSQCLILSASGLVSYNVSTTPERVKGGIEAIGSGAKAAMCAYEALGWEDPQRAVSIVCRHDAGSRAPVRTYKL
jgi:ATP-dependent protease HslVU (ClpYQ) peptidase subunit